MVPLVVHMMYYSFFSKDVERMTTMVNFWPLGWNKKSMAICKTILTIHTSNRLLIYGLEKDRKLAFGRVIGLLLTGDLLNNLYAEPRSLR